MSEFAEEFTIFRPPVSVGGMDTTTMGFLDSFPELNAGAMADDSPGLGLGLMGFSGVDGFLPPQPEFPVGAYVGDLPGFLPVECPAPAPVEPTAAAVREESPTSKRRRAVAASDGAASVNSSTPVSGSSISGEEKPKKKDSSSKGKRGRCGGKDEAMVPKEVVHVRARRGQATDSHSLAERPASSLVRREKINEKMRCLKDLVPGCYKAMGMAVMLDEIINYVQSLQNQVEFLSMKLSAASAVYDFNQDLDPSLLMPQLLPRVGEADEAQEVDRLMRGGYERCTSFHPTMPF